MQFLNFNTQMNNYILDENGNVKSASLAEWGAWFENAENRIIANTVIDEKNEIHDETKKVCRGDNKKARKKSKKGVVTISTVFLGIDHNFIARPCKSSRTIDDPWESSFGNYDPHPPDWAPILFETMIFGGPYDEYQWRYRTKKAAETHHHELVNILKSGGVPNTDEHIL